MANFLSQFQTLFILLNTQNIILDQVSDTRKPNHEPPRNRRTPNSKHKRKIGRNRLKIKNPRSENLRFLPNPRRGFKNSGKSLPNSRFVGDKRRDYNNNSRVTMDIQGINLSINYSSSPLRGRNRESQRRLGEQKLGTISYVKARGEAMETMVVSPKENHGNGTSRCNHYLPSSLVKSIIRKYSALVHLEQLVVEQLTHEQVFGQLEPKPTLVEETLRSGVIMNKRKTRIMFGYLDNVSIRTKHVKLVLILKECRTAICVFYTKRNSLHEAKIVNNTGKDGLRNLMKHPRRTDLRRSRSICVWLNMLFDYQPGLGDINYLCYYEMCGLPAVLLSKNAYLISKTELVENYPNAQNYILLFNYYKIRQDDQIKETMMRKRMITVWLKARSVKYLLGRLCNLDLLYDSTNRKNNKNDGKIPTPKEATYTMSVLIWKCLFNLTLFDYIFFWTKSCYNAEKFRTEQRNEQKENQGCKKGHRNERRMKLKPTKRPIRRPTRRIPNKIQPKEHLRAL